MNWANSERIVVYENQVQLDKFIQDAKAHENLKQKMYFGIASPEIVNLFKQAANIDVSNHNLSLRADTVLKQFKSHGNEAKENLRGQRGVTDEDIKSIPDFLNNITNAIYAGEYEDESHKPTPFINLKSSKYPKHTIGVYKQGTHLDIRIHTLYINNKKGSNAVAVNALKNSPLPITSKTDNGNASFNDSIPDPNEIVKNSLDVDVNIEEYFDEEFYDRFNYEDDSKITKSIEELEKESNELWALSEVDDSYRDVFYPVKEQLNALKAGLPFKTAPQLSVDTVSKSASKSSIFNPNEIVKNSLDVDCDGNKLSKQQQEYFKDSKVRDRKRTDWEF